LMRFFCGSTFL